MSVCGHVFLFFRFFLFVWVFFVWGGGGLLRCFWCSRFDRFVVVFCIQSFTPSTLGVGVGVGRIGVYAGEATMVLIARLIAANILTIVTPCSLNKVFSPNPTSFSNMLLILSLILLIWLRRIRWLVLTASSLARLSSCFSRNCLRSSTTNSLYPRTWASMVNFWISEISSSSSLNLAKLFTSSPWVVCKALLRPNRSRNGRPSARYFSSRRIEIVSWVSRSTFVATRGKSRIGMPSISIS